VNAVDDVADGRLADAKPLAQLGLRKAGCLSIGLKCLHMSPKSIGNDYEHAIGHSDAFFDDPFGMPKKRTVLDRAMEALEDRFPRDKPTQARLAALAGVKQPSVNDWREGHPSMDTAVRLSENLGICVEWLLTERGPKRPQQVDKSGAEEITGIWQQLDERQRAQLARYADFIKDE
jgi:hypothetical protein